MAEKLPLLALAALAMAMTLWTQRSAIAPDAVIGFSWRLRYVAIAYVTYLGKLFCPIGLAGLYPRPGLDVPLGQTCGALGGSLGRYRGGVGPAAAKALLAGRLALVFGDVGAGNRVRASRRRGGGRSQHLFAADRPGDRAGLRRSRHLPRRGTEKGTAPFVQSTRGAVPAKGACPLFRRATALAAGLALAVLMVAAWRQTWFWHDSETLWNRTLACTSNNLVAHINLGGHFRATGRPAKAAVQYQQVLAINPAAQMPYSAWAASICDWDNSTRPRSFTKRPWPWTRATRPVATTLDLSWRSQVAMTRP